MKVKDEFGKGEWNLFPIHWQCRFVRHGTLFSEKYQLWHFIAID
jgi:hypothetical protein